MINKLQIHPQSKNQNIEVLYDYSLSLEALKVNFIINNYGPMYVSNHFSNKAYRNWGLWNFDVVEFFFRPIGTKNEYLELQVSPLNQQFQLCIVEPRNIFYTPLDLNFDSHVNKSDDQISIDLVIPNTWNTLDFEGNFFAILGSDATRSYLAANVDTSVAPNFHRPDLFRKL